MSERNWGVFVQKKRVNRFLSCQKLGGRRRKGELWQACERGIDRGRNFGLRPGGCHQRASQLRIRSTASWWVQMSCNEVEWQASVRESDGCVQTRCRRTGKVLSNQRRRVGETWRAYLSKCNHKNWPHPLSLFSPQLAPSLSAVARPSPSHSLFLSL